MPPIAHFLLFAASSASHPPLFPPAPLSPAAQPHTSSYTDDLPSTASSTPPFDPLSASFRPSIAVIIGVLTTMFSLTFLLLLYAKHCKRTRAGPPSVNMDGATSNAAPPPPPSLPPLPALRGRNSGVERTVIDALPMFSFSSLQGLKEGLECAVCLSRFEKLDLLRLLPKCKHAFHLECVDTWLGNHSTCPLCRNRVEAEDVLIVEDFYSGAKQSAEEHFTPAQSVEGDFNAGRLSSSSARISSSGSMGGDSVMQLYIQRGCDAPCASSPSTFLAWDAARRTQRQGGVLMMGARKDPLLLAMAQKEAEEQRLSQRFWHRIIVSDVVFQHRWSDFVPSDALFLDSHTLLAHRCSGQRYSVSKRGPVHDGDEEAMASGEATCGHLQASRHAIDATGKVSQYSRSLSEVSGLERYAESREHSLMMSSTDAGSADHTNCRDDARTQRWLSIVRKTLTGWLPSAGASKRVTSYRPEGSQ